MAVAVLSCFSVIQSPVILEGCAFAESALKWDLDFLKENMRDENHTTYISPNHKFLYYDIELMHGKFRDWKPPTHSDNVYFEEFLELVEQLKAADNGSHAYFQVRFRPHTSSKSTFSQPLTEKRISVAVRI